MFLVETKLITGIWEALKNKLKFEGYFVVDSKGKSGELALPWRVEVGVSIQSYSQHHINALIH